MHKAWHDKTGVLLGHDRTEKFLQDVLPERVASVLDVGHPLGESANFFGYFGPKKLSSFNWDASAFDDSLYRYCKSYQENSFDAVQSLGAIDHIPAEKRNAFFEELKRVSSDLVFVTTNNKLIDTTTQFSQQGFHILFEDENAVIAFFRKIPQWNSRFLDMEDYVKACCKDMSVESVIDFGTGMKGAVAEQYWEKEQKIRVGYAVDIFKIKYAAPQERIWIPVKRDAFEVLQDMEQKSIDVIQAFGFLEHLEEAEAEKFLVLAETRARKLLIVSAATFLHECDGDFSGTRKAIREGNPHHAYRSLWHWKRFQELGFRTNFLDMRQGISFSDEAIAWKFL